jgi:DNA modification methylase
MTVNLSHGDCLEVLRGMADASVDSIVTDPPYGLSFMGKRWDYDVPSEEIWRECLRVLKPGGHLLAFAGTRTQHRMALRIEDAGFEIRDMIAWVYGSGFPKSLDVSKAIDKMDAAQEQEARRYRFTAWVRSTGVTARQIDDALGTHTMGRHYTDVPPNGKQPAIMTREHLEQCRHLLGDAPEWVEREADIRSVESRNMAEREVVGVQKGAMAGWSMDGGTKFVDRNITAPATPEAQQWAGWGTALKPALEPITMARKPFKGTVAANVLEHSTGALNVDGCRISGKAYSSGGKNKSIAFGRSLEKQERCNGSQGRWPANLIHDGSDEVVGMFPQSSGGHWSYKQAKDGGIYKHGLKDMEDAGTDKTTGSAARFFYCAKASKADRDEGCEGLEERDAMDFIGSGVDGRGNDYETKPRRNHHPTVKPTALMRYLCRLVTPPGGTVLDPFMGSGSTGKAAVLEDFNFIGIELEAEYVEIAKARIAAAQAERGGMLPLEGVAA